ncbi:MAG: hypothetical protein ABSG70_11655 [Terriglobales bacterium]
MERKTGPSKTDFTHELLLSFGIRLSALNRQPGTLIIFQHRKHMPKFFHAGCKLITPLVSEKHR